MILNQIKPGENLLYSCTHTLGGKVVAVDLVLVSVSLEIRCLDETTKKVWRHQIALGLLSAMIQRYYFELDILWDLLAKAMYIAVAGIRYSTQHIVHFKVIMNSKGFDAHLIYECSKKISDEEIWTIYFLSECTYPFALEMVILKNPLTAEKYIYRIDSDHLRILFQKHCYHRYYEDISKIVYVGEKDTNHMLNALVDDLIYDEDLNTMYVKHVERMKIEDFLSQSVINNDERMGDVLETQYMLSREESEETIHVENEGGVHRLTCRSSEVEVVRNSHSNQINNYALASNGRNSTHPSGSNSTHDDDVINGFLSNMQPFDHNKEPPPIDDAKQRSLLHASHHLINESDFDDDNLNNSYDYNNDMVMSGDVIDVKKAETKLNFEEQIFNRRSKFHQRKTDHSKIPKTQTNADKNHNDKYNHKHEMEDKRILYSEGNSELSNDGTISEVNLIKNNFETSQTANKESVSDTFSPSVNAVEENINETVVQSNDYYDLYKITEDNDHSDSVASIQSTTSLASNYYANMSNSNLFSNKIGRKNAFLQNRLGQKAADKRKNSMETSYIMVKEALQIRAEYRSEMSIKSVTNMLTNMSKLSNYLHYCSDFDVKAIANSLTIKEINNEVEVLAEFGDLITMCYIILQGSIEIVCRSKQDHYQYHKYTTARQHRANTQEYTQILYPGDFIGMVALTGEYVWDINVKTKENDHLILCCLPIDIIQKYIGKTTAEAKDTMICFWKFTQLWNTIISHNKLVIETNARAEKIFGDNLGLGSFSTIGSVQNFNQNNCTSFNNHNLNHNNTNASFSGRQRFSARDLNNLPRGIPNSHQYPSRMSIASNISSQSTKLLEDHKEHFALSQINVVESVRIRSFPPGEDIFKQGTPRHKFILILQGSCAFIRNIQRSCNDNHTKINVIDNSGNNNNDDETVEVDLGLRLLPGDFSFMDGEDTAWVDNYKKQEESVAIDYGNPILNERKRSLYNKFGRHKNSLISLSRTEVCVVPLKQIAKSLALFKGLLKISAKKYKYLFINDTELINKYTEFKIWKENRADVLSMVGKERKSLVLDGQWKLNMNSNISDRYYNDKKEYLSKFDKLIISKRLTKEKITSKHNCDTQNLTAINKNDNHCLHKNCNGPVEKRPITAPVNKNTTKNYGNSDKRIDEEDIRPATSPTPPSQGRSKKRSSFGRNIV